MSGIIYLDNAATTFPKPQCVHDAVRAAMTSKGGNPGRGSHKMSLAAAELIFDARCTAADIFNSTPENVVFTGNATQALNYAIKGLASPGCHILLDNFAHNAAYRPILALANAKVCSYDIYDASGNAEETITNIKNKLHSNTTIIVATHQSNICSKVLPIKKIGQLCRERGVHFIVDGSQSAGHLPIDVEEMQITSLCLPGHKGLWGPMGVGMLISASGVNYRTLIEGGAGISSLDAKMPDELPERLEAGTLPLPAISGMLAGMKWVNSIGTDKIHDYESMLSSIFAREVKKIDRAIVYGEANGSVTSFNLDGYSPSRVAEHLSSRGICVRTGYHCAPLAHKTVGSFEGGSVRIGVSYMNRPSDIYALVEALQELSSKL